MSANQQTVNIRRANGSVDVINRDQVLLDEFVLPGFRIDPLRLVFER